MILRCPECKDLRECINLRTKGWRCWRCIHTDLFVPDEEYEVPSACLEGIEVLRRVEPQDPNKWGMLLVTAMSNSEAMVCASVEWGMCSMSARPIWALEKHRD